MMKNTIRSLQRKLPCFLVTSQHVQGFQCFLHLEKAAHMVDEVAQDDGSISIRPASLSNHTTSPPEVITEPEREQPKLSSENPVLIIITP